MRPEILEGYCSKCGWKLEAGGAGKKATCWNCTSTEPSCAGCGKLLVPGVNCPSCARDGQVRVAVAKGMAAKSRDALACQLDTAVKELGLGVAWDIANYIANECTGWRGKAADAWCYRVYHGLMGHTDKLQEATHDH